MMDAPDNRQLITMEIPGAFLQGDCPQNKHSGYIIFEGIMMEMICNIDP